MSVFSYSGRNANGRTLRGFLVAETPKAARASLQEQGILLATITPASLKGKFNLPLRTQFYADAGMLLSQGFTIEEALNLLVEENPGEAAGIFTALRDRILGGDSLADAVSSLTPSLPPFEAAALKTAEKTGAQDQMLRRLADFLEADRNTMSQIRSALVYPCAVLLLAFALLGLMVFVILPKAQALFPSTNVPSSTLALMKFAPASMAFIVFLFAAISCTFVCLASRAKKFGGQDAIRYENLLLKIPLLKRLLPLLWSSRFAGTMALLLNAGLTPQSSVSPSGAATGSQTIAQLADSAATDVQGGLPLGKAISFISPIAPHLSAWIGVGEKAGALSEMLEKASSRARTEYEKKLTHFLALLEPSLVAFVGAIVLFVALSVIRPMLDLTTRGM